MKKKIRYFVIFALLISSSSNTQEKTGYIDPEPYQSEANYNNKNLESSEIIVVTANDYATKVGYDILKKGGNVIDAAISIQMILGLVEPQSSGIGGGTFVTYYDNNLKKTYSFEGREEAPSKIPEDLFLDQNGNSKKFFTAVVGGLSVGVPALLKTFSEMHKEFGKLEWSELIKPAINLSEKGFFPPKRLINALKNERFFFQLYPNSKLKEIINNPNKKFKNLPYAKTLREISLNVDHFYNGKIAKNIVQEVNNSKNPGYLSLKDLETYLPEKNKAFCKSLNNYSICGPNLPSSGTICIIQAMMLYENLIKKRLKDEGFNPLELKLSILDFIYYLRETQLADPKFESIDLRQLTNIDYLENQFLLFNNNNNINADILEFDEIFNSTTHFSLVDKYNNVISVTSSIESSFGSRLFTNGFFLNNQLTDFSFKTFDVKNKKIKNSPAGGKRPLSSMAPLIIFDKNNEFFMTVGSPGGKAIISYVFKTLTDILYDKKNIIISVKSPNYLKIKGKTFIEDPTLLDPIKFKAKVRKLNSGLAIIKKDNNNLLGVADFRRDGSVRGK
ncbi:MAG: gamma-glutamyltransferase family protein [Alphaproteobacteria bacterium]